MLTILLVILALVCFLVRAFAPGVTRFHLGWLGMAVLTVAVWLIPAL